jgi:hypothetical protein
MRERTNLARLRLLEAVQATPRLGIGRIARCEPAGHRGEDHVARLALLHLPAERLPLLVPGHIRRFRLWNPPLLERLQVLHPDQQRVPERPRPEPGSELERTPPVIARDELLDRAGQALVQGIELRVARRSCLLVRRHNRPPPGGAGGVCRWPLRP